MSGRKDKKPIETIKLTKKALNKQLGAKDGSGRLVIKTDKGDIIIQQKRKLQTTIQLDPDLFYTIEQIKNEQGISKNFTIEQALRVYFGIFRCPECLKKGKKNNGVLESKEESKDYFIWHFRCPTCRHGWEQQITKP